VFLCPGIGLFGVSIVLIVLSRMIGIGVLPVLFVGVGLELIQRISEFLRLLRRLGGFC